MRAGICDLGRDSRDRGFECCGSNRAGTAGRVRGRELNEFSSEEREALVSEGRRRDCGIDAL